MENAKPRVDEIVQAAGRLAPAPTLVLGIGHEALTFAREVGARLNLPWAISINAPVRYPQNEATLGIVSGTDDASFWNESLVSKLGLPAEDLQQLATTARLLAVKDLHASRALGARPIPPQLFAQNVFCISFANDAASLRYELCLIRSRKPDHIYLASPPEIDITALVTNGLVDSAF